MGLNKALGVLLVATDANVSEYRAEFPAWRSPATRAEPAVLRLVRLMFDAPEARRVAVAGDFNGWDADATQLTRDERSRRWSVTLALHDGQHRYAFVVDGTRWVPDPRGGRSVQGADGRVYSLLSLSRTSN